VIEGCPVSVEGVSESWRGTQGGVCGKGAATIMDYHNPNRCNYPVKRTNPRKGVHEDPKWKRVSWEEALDTITERLKEVRENDPRGLLFAHAIIPFIRSLECIMSFLSAFGTYSFACGGTAAHCGSGVHLFTRLMHGSQDELPDYKYCNYLLRCGGNEGIASGRKYGESVQSAAEARDRGMRTIVMDPQGYISGGKAVEWVPILPATDSAVFLAMANFLLNEIGIYDKEYVRDKTNGPYLVAPNRLFVRNRENGKPLLWDEKNGMAKTYDDPTLACPALEGEFTVDGVNCQPAFQLLKEHLKQYDAKWASEISTVPEKIIRRLAKELSEEAKIGSTIDVEGVKVPYRPACVIGGYKGAKGHQNSFHRMVRSFGYPETGRPRFEPCAGYDGMLIPGLWLTGAELPPKEAKLPSSVDLSDFSYWYYSGYPYFDDWNEIWTKAGRPYEPEALMLYGGNVAINCVKPKSAEKFLSKVPFIFSVNTIHNETTEGFADIVLPESHFLEGEDLGLSPCIGLYNNYPLGLDDWSFHVTMPVVEAQYERRNMIGILSDLADRLGIRSEYNTSLDSLLSKGCPKAQQGEAQGYHILRSDEKIPTKELTDRVLKFYFGKEQGLEWFREHGFITWKKRPEECYWRYSIDARVPVYYEFLEREREMIREVGEKIGVELNWEYFTPLVSYFPSLIYTEVPADSQFDLIAISHRDVLHTHRFSADNPWIDEMSSTNPYTYNIVMNMEVAKRKGIREGDMIRVESHSGGEITGRVKLAQAIHPQVIAMVTMGGWAKGRAIARGKGVNFNELLKGDHNHLCPITGVVEGAVRVKVRRVEGTT
jgi:molybdopterin-containing oxidoreductase family molybdopterin binding subunit